MTTIREPHESHWLQTILKCAVELEAKGWVVPRMYEPGKKFLILEAGSTGVHSGFCDEFGYWIVDGDTYPSWPFMVKEIVDVGLKVYEAEEAKGLDGGGDSEEASTMSQGVYL